jgi:hypothetical protein
MLALQTFSFNSLPKLSALKTLYHGNVLNTFAYTFNRQFKGSFDVVTPPPLYLTLGNEPQLMIFSNKTLKTEPCIFNWGV